ncbi:MAG TPA: GAF domain-containing protein [Solirubrobacterales bacterium]|jgi:signal transduction histidine kinase|nr:GAF domain-containing protein [Solirubrobacterales bacterium]
MDPVSKSVVELAGDVLAELDTETVLRRVLGAARELTDARYAALGVLNEEGTELAQFVTLGIGEEEVRRIGPLPRGHGVLGELIRNPVPLRLEQVGEHPHSYGFPSMHPTMKTFLGVPVSIGGAAFGNLYLTDKEGGAEFTAEDEEATVLFAQFAGVAIDHARRLARSEGRGDRLQRAVDALDATVTIARTLAGQTDLDAILELVAKRGRALVSARALVIELEAGGELEIVAVAGEVPRELIGQTVNLEDSVAGQALRAQRPQRLENVVNRARYDEHGLGRRGLDAAAGLIVPLVLRGNSYGALVAIDRQTEGPDFSDQDEELLESFASSAAIAVATAKSVDAERQRERLAATESERSRWARELHDETLQGLAALRLSLAAIGKAAPEQVEGLVEQAGAEVEEEIVKLRSLITDLRPASLDQLGAGPALEALAERMRLRGLEVDLRLDLAFEAGRASTRHDEELETALYRIVQEAVNNAVSHGEASRVEVEVAEHDGAVTIVVRDDGAGFDTTRRSDGFGLRGMRERAELLDGSVEVDSAPGRSTTVRAMLPARRRPVSELTAARERRSA